MRIAGIGSRKTPTHILTEMTKVGEWVKEKGFTLYSGGAAGADEAFENGARDCCRVFWPWYGFSSGPGTSSVVEATPALDFLVRRFHPAPQYLKFGAFALMRRNACQILGEELRTPVSAVVCWRVKSSGTDQAIRIANHFGVRVLNMADSQFESCVKVVAELGEISKEPSRDDELYHQLKALLEEEFGGGQIEDAMKPVRVVGTGAPKTVVRKRGSA